MRKGYKHVDMDTAKTTAMTPEGGPAANAKDIEDRSTMQYLFYFVLFMMMGWGANFSLPTVLLEEIPYFEESQPEGVCIATFMNVVTSCGIFSIFAYLAYHVYVKPIPYSVSVPTLLFVQCIGAFVTAAVYPITIGGVSLLLYMCCFIGGSVGGLGMVIMNPFMTSYENNFISAARGGASFFVLLCASIAAAQGPGASYQRFSAAVYCCIMGAILCLSPPAYYYITRNNIGLRENAPFAAGSGGGNSSTIDDSRHVQQKGTHEEEDGDNSIASAYAAERPDGDGNEIQLNPMVLDLNHISTDNGTAEEEQKAVAESDSVVSVDLEETGTAQARKSSGNGNSNSNSTGESTSTRSSSVTKTQPPVGGGRQSDNLTRRRSSQFKRQEMLIDFKSMNIWRPQFIQTIEEKIAIMMRRISCWLISDSLAVKYPWARRAVPYVLLIVWANFNTWGITSAIFPFAVYNAYGGSDAAASLGIGYQLGGVLLVMGDISTTVLRLDLMYANIVFTITCLVVYAAAANLPGFDTPVSGPLVVAVYCVERFFESHIVTTCFRIIATEFPLRDKQFLSQTAGMIGQIGTFVGAVLTTIIVSSVRSC